MVVCQISRARVELGDALWAARQFDGDAIPENQLREWQGRVTWCIEGYDTTAGELYEIPAVRTFVRNWRRLKPHWLYFGALETDNLKVLYVALLGDATAVANDRTGQCCVSYDRYELGKILAADLEIADRLSERAGFNVAHRLKRARDVMRYFEFGKECR